MLVTHRDGARGDALPLPAELERLYGGPLRLRSRVVFANFVSTIDGVTSYGSPGIAAARFISGGYAGDRFVLALLRAAADAVVVGAGTLRQEPESVWTAASVYPDAADAFAALRTALGRPASPPTVIATMSGDVDLSLPAFHSGVPVVIATTRAGARSLATPPPGVTVQAVSGEGPIAAASLVRLAEEVSGGTRIITEGGPTLLGQFLRERALDELFLTIAPGLAGRTDALKRMALVEGAGFTPRDAPRATLASLRTSGDYLFTRWALARS